jgi:CRP/FNR family cyclic AMP-dependent transcriptional regulator
MAKYPAQLRIATERRAPDLGNRSVPKLNPAANAESIPLVSSKLFEPVIWARSRTPRCETSYSRGSLLFIEGQTASGVYLIEKGCVKLTICSGRGKSLILGFFGPQTLLGLPAAILGLPHEATAVSVRPTAARFVARDELIRHLRQAGDAGLRAAQLVSQTLYSTLRDVERFWLSDSVEQKLARFFVSLCPPRNECVAPIHLAFDLTHEDISQRIGVSRETVTRLLSRFKKRRIVNLTRSMLTIFDLGALKRIADWPVVVRSSEANLNAAVWR